MSNAKQLINAMPLAVKSGMIKAASVTKEAMPEGVTEFLKDPDNVRRLLTGVCGIGGASIGYGVSSDENALRNALIGGGLGAGVGYGLGGMLSPEYESQSAGENLELAELQSETEDPYRTSDPYPIESKKSWPGLVDPVEDAFGGQSYSQPDAMYEGNVAEDPQATGENIDTSALKGDPWYED